MAQDDHLLQPVGGGHPDPVAPADLVGGLFNVHICSFRLFCVNNVDIAPFFHTSWVVFHLVGVKDQDHAAALVALVIAQDVDEGLPGRVQIHLGQGVQLLPGENDVVAVHQQVLLHRLEILNQFDPALGVAVQTGAPALGLRTKGLLLDGAVGALEYFLQLLVRCRRRRPAPVNHRGGPFFFLLFRSQHSAGVQMGVFRHLVPLYHRARPVGAEHRVRRVVHVRLRVIVGGGDDLFGVVAAAVPRQGAGQPSPSPGVGGQLGGVVPHGGHRRAAGEHGGLAVQLRVLKFPLHLLDIRHGPAQIFLGNLQTELIPRLQQHGPGLHQPLPDGPVGGLPEVAALGVLQVGPAREQRHLHIRDGGAGEHPQVLLFLQMGENQPLPVQIQGVQAAHRVKDQTGTRLPRLQQQVHLRVVAQGLKVPDADDRRLDGLFVHDGAGAELHI